MQNQRQTLTTPLMKEYPGTRVAVPLVADVVAVPVGEPVTGEVGGAVPGTHCE